MDLLVNILEQHGVGVALAAAIGFVAWRLFKHVISNHKEDRKIWKETLDSQQKLVMNHMTHLEASNTDVAKGLEVHVENSKRDTAEIVKAIETQTKMIQTYLSANNTGA